MEYNHLIFELLIFPPLTTVIVHDGCTLSFSILVKYMEGSGPLCPTKSLLNLDGFYPDCNSRTKTISKSQICTNYMAMHKV